MPENDQPEGAGEQLDGAGAAVIDSPGFDRRAFLRRTAISGVAAGSVAAWYVVTRVMNLTFAWLPGPAAAAAFGALLVTVALGLIGTFAALGHKPATVLRNL